VGYSSAFERRAILKMVNYKNSAFDRLNARIEYLLQPKKTSSEWQKGHFINPGNAMHDFQVIYDRHHPKGTRFFRQGILSFGVKEVSVDTAFEVGCEVFKNGYENYPYFLCVHTDLPNHIHVHFLHFTVNLKDGTKWAQSPAGLIAFREHTDSVLENFKLPLLKKKTKTDEPNAVDDVVEEVAKDGIIYPMRPTNIHSSLPYQKIYYPSCSLVSENFSNRTSCVLDLPRLQNEIIKGLAEIKKIFHGGAF